MTRDEEIEAARTWATGFTLVVEGDADVRFMLLRALDALAKEPATEAVLHRKNVRIGVLGARLARVREAMKKCEEWLRAAEGDDKQAWSFLSCWLCLVDALAALPVEETKP